MKYTFVLMSIFISLAGCANNPVSKTDREKESLIQSTAPQENQGTSIAASNQLDSMELRKAKDIDTRRAEVDASGKIEDLANVTAEVDEWFFLPDEGEQARKKIEAMTQELRDRISSEVKVLSIAAIEAPNGQASTEKLSRMNIVLSLYPSPNTNEQRDEFDQLKSHVLLTYKQVEDIQRLRYNKWAIKQIQDGLKQYRDLTKVKSYKNVKKMFGLSKKDQEKSIEICVSSLKAINPQFLEPAVLDLYNHYYKLTRDGLQNDDLRLIKLASGLTNPDIIRKSISEF